MIIIQRSWHLHCYFHHILKVFFLFYSPKVVPCKRKYPGRGWGDAGGATLFVLHPDHFCQEPAHGPLCPLAGHHHRGRQHQHAAVWHWCGAWKKHCGTVVFSVFVSVCVCVFTFWMCKDTLCTYYKWVRAPAATVPSCAPPICTSSCSNITVPATVQSLSDQAEGNRTSPHYFPDLSLSVTQHKKVHPFTHNVKHILVIIAPCGWKL